MQNRPEGIGAAARNIAGAGRTPSIAHATDTRTHPRRPCRACKRPDSRPVVPIGSSRWWDLCYRCAGRVSRAYAALGGAAADGVVLVDLAELPDQYLLGHLNLDWSAREALGRELAAVARG